MEVWRDQAACRHTDTALWFPERLDADAIAPLRAICDHCPVWWPCIQEALRVEIDCRFGFRAGFTPDERADLARGNGAPRRRQRARLAQRPDTTMPDPLPAQARHRETAGQKAR